MIFIIDFFGSPEVDVRAFMNPVAAISEIKTTSPDLVLVDYRLLGTTGDEVARQISPRIPKALLTGESSVTLSKNFVKVFYKPFDFAEMEIFIQSYLRKKGVR